MNLVCSAHPLTCPIIISNPIFFFPGTTLSNVQISKYRKQIEEVAQHFLKTGFWINPPGQLTTADKQHQLNPALGDLLTVGSAFMKNSIVNQLGFAQKPYQMHSSKKPKLALVGDLPTRLALKNACKELKASVHVEGRQGNAPATCQVCRQRHATNLTLMKCPNLTRIVLEMKKSIV